MTNQNHNPLDDPLFQQLIIERNLQPESVRHYKKALILYCKYHQMTLTELYNEADTEEEQGIRAKNRKIVQRLRSYRTHLIQEGYSTATITHYYQSVRTFYHHYLIEIPYIPRVKLPTKQVMYDDIPHKEHIIEALAHTNNLKHRAIIYFMASSGTARNETCQLTIQDFIDATKDYHTSSNIYDVVNELEGRDNIVPLFQLTRAKTNYRYYTCTTPEATQHIIRYLKTRPLKRLRPQQTLFNIKPNTLSIAFNRLNMKCKWPDKFFHPHALRKYHTNVLNDWELANTLQGRKPSVLRETYYKQDPSRIKAEYIKHLQDLTLQPSKVVTIESDEVKQLKKVLDTEKRKNEELQKRVDNIESEAGVLGRKLDELINNFEG